MRGVFVFSFLVGKVRPRRRSPFGGHKNVRKPKSPRPKILKGARKSLFWGGPRGKRILSCWVGEEKKENKFFGPLGKKSLIVLQNLIRWVNKTKKEIEADTDRNMGFLNAQKKIGFGGPPHLVGHKTYFSMVLE